ncbi:MAG TPA: hypothetical protein DHU63_08840 [Candidatus Marinimicrobia bacterium]|nr:MAG: hypothetical protein AUJ47_05140 [Candidatus Marinimicrobia bacterium CG1_02_48_14]PJA54443.1 MAG: hypothetical protein CO167_03805 [Candidatus Marinimicrobia bacterium CG_4_9_14_3_um_filter_48_9]HCW76631.1 hypothetical protein [Candidatus Neomarinimicrobiota bacterium]
MEETGIPYEGFGEKRMHVRNCSFPRKPFMNANHQGSGYKPLKEYFPQDDHPFSHCFKHNPHQNIFDNFWYCLHSR